MNKKGYYLNDPPDEEQPISHTSGTLSRVRGTARWKEASGSQVALPPVSLLSTDDSLRRCVESVCAQLGLRLTFDPEGAASIIDPGVGAERIRAWAPKASAAAIIHSQGFPGFALLALRLSRGTFVEDPRVAPESLRTHLTESLVLDSARRERRAFPRAPGSGVQLIEPLGAELVDVSPYGARLRISKPVPNLVVLRLRVAFEQSNFEDEIQCQVVERIDVGDQIELRLRFARLRRDSQQELFRIAKAHLFCRTISEMHAQCESGDAEGYRRVLDVHRLTQILCQLADEEAEVRFAHMARGRVQVGTVVRVETHKRLLVVRVSNPELGDIADRVCYSTAAANGTWLMDGYLVGRGEDEIVLTFPNACVAAELRAQDRLFLGPSSALRVRVHGEDFPVTDVSARGFSFHVPQAESWTIPAARLDVCFDLGDGTVHGEHVLVRNARAATTGLIVGCTFGEPRNGPSDAVTPIVREEVTETVTSIEQMDRTYESQKVRFMAVGDRQVVGLWTETLSRSRERLVLIVPPAWAKTKESVSLLSQFFCATFDRSNRHVAVLRFDYTDALGESEKAPEFQTPGQETLGLTFSRCVENIHGAISYACSRCPGAVIALIGMSFSGPLVLRAAVENPSVALLFQLMGASDNQELVRRASGGIDFVNRYRAGIRTGPQNVLGVLSDTDRWVADGLRSELLHLQSAQADAAKLNIPLLWIHGRHDAFVSEERIRSVMDFAGSSERRLVVLPCGHVPTKTAEALMSYVPIADYLLRRNGGSKPVFAAPSRDLAAQVARLEWHEAPRAGLPSPRQYWHDYMLGQSEISLGFDVLAMTREYHELMRLQCALLEHKGGDVVHDVGGGLGHSLLYLGSGTAVHIYDLVPEALEAAKRRGATLGGIIEATEWDAENGSVPEALGNATHILMSLFLSCLADANKFLCRLSDHLRPGTRIVASTMRPDADLSGVYTGLLRDIAAGEVTAGGYSQRELIDAVREYMNSAAWLLRLADEGTFRLFDEAEFRSLFEKAGFGVLAVHRTFGSPERALVLVGEKR
jgi:SAM-dependent methyltransferase